jgi:HSP20 family protein
MPAADVKENAKELVIKVELPGVEEENIYVTIAEDSVVIKGEKKEEKEDMGKNCDYMESSYGSLNRRIPLAVEVESENVSASFRNGMLNIKIPKKQNVQNKGIKVPIKIA